MNDPKDLRILFLRKRHNEFAERAERFVRGHFRKPLIFSGDRNDKLPREVLNWKGDYLISFISPWIYPEELLANAASAAINFHPGSPEYPGTGCTNFAIYEGASEYGVTCHHMNTGVDSGKIIVVKRFPLVESDTVYSVTQHCYELIEEIFHELMDGILRGRPLPETDEQWKRKPFTRKQLDELCTITPDMSEAEIERRIKATTFETPWAFTRIGKHIFRLQAGNK
jgi:methionyl-tRNA formyltransferase